LELAPEWAASVAAVELAPEWAASVAAVELAPEWAASVSVVELAFESVASALDSAMALVPASEQPALARASLLQEQALQRVLEWAQTLGTALRPG
jgi:hypothetical protein